MKHLFRLVLPFLFVSQCFAAAATQMTIAHREKISPLTAIVMKSAASGSAKLSSYTITDAATGDVIAPLFVYGAVSKAKIERIGGTVGTEFQDWKTVQLPVSLLPQLLALPDVSYVESAPPVFPLDAIANSDTVTGGGLWIGNGAAAAHGLYDGTGVLVGVIDVGTDWSHLDFRRDDDPTISRIQYFWDMAGTATGGRVHPAGFSYGVEYTNAHVNNEIDGTPAGFVPNLSSSGYAHGTATASIAAGDGSAHVSGLAKGVAPGADYLIVKTRGTSVLSFATDLVDAVNWMFQKAAELNKPIAINISLGSHWGAHDGSRADEQYITAQSGAGKVVVIACGNSGISNIHAMGTVAPSGSQNSTFSIPASCASALFDIWYHGSDAYTLRITSPGAQLFQYTSGTDAEAVFTGNDTVDVYNGTNTLGAPTNGAKHIVVDMYGSGSNPLASGTWTFEFVRTANGGDGNWDAWMVQAGATVTFTSQVSNTRSLTMPATADGAIAVGGFFSGGQYTDVNSDPRGNATNNGMFWTGSSRGPTRTGGQKPDIIAATSLQRVTLPGSMVVNDTLKIPGGFHYVVSTGTSYAAPQVTGAVALLLDKWSTLTPTDVKNKLFAAAKTDAQTGAVWNGNVGYGKLHVANALQAAAQTVSQTGQNTTYSGTNVVSNFSTLPGGSWEVTVDRTNTTAPNLTGGVLSLPFYLDINSNLSNGTFDVTLSVSYTNEELGLIDESMLTLCYYNGADWVPLPNQNLDLLNNTVSGSSDHLTQFAVLNNSNGTLPVALSSFSANFGDGFIRLNWRVESETNNAYWRIERATSDEGFTEVSRVNGRGNASTAMVYQWDDRRIIAGQTYRYRLSDVDFDGTVTTHDQIVEVTATSGTATPIPTDFALSEPYPNPFNATVSIRFSLPVSQEVRLVVVDIQGRKVADLAQGEWKSGTYNISWNPSGIASGLYFVRLDATDWQAVRKVMYLR